MKKIERTKTASASLMLVSILASAGCTSQQYQPNPSPVVSQAMQLELLPPQEILVEPEDLRILLRKVIWSSNGDTVNNSTP